ncbi:MAG TPA: hypothetical protein VE783_12310 [Candidatus Limnocylindrales bacterium]|jgi:quercetin dioxygenase-like cupin family protein|nr:hypothetical protein [Candidatus Limnocylindrales bacterium]
MVTPLYVTAQSLSRNLRLRAQGALSLVDGAVELGTGELLVLEPGVPHGVEALEEAAFVLTLS